jgi:hypothetical protein
VARAKQETNYAEQAPRGLQADPTRTEPVGRNRKERDHLGTFDHEVAWLDKQIDDPDTWDGPLNHYRRRRAAIAWALTRIADAERLEST